MDKRKAVYLLALSAQQDRAREILDTRYPGYPLVVLSKRKFHEGGWISAFREFRKLKGCALFIFVESLDKVDQPLLMRCVGMVHRCHETVLSDASGRLEVWRRLDLLLQLPLILYSFFLDAVVCLVSLIALHVLRSLFAKPVESRPGEDFRLELAYLYPFPFQQIVPGGEMSYLKGTLSGLAEEAAKIGVFSGCPLPLEDVPVDVIPNRRRFYLFRESLALSYNARFLLGIRRQLAEQRPRILYQRHNRFVIVGALLSRLLRIPLVLEYQSSEVWRAKNWDPVRFLHWLRLCEDLSIMAASKFVVLSEALRGDLLGRGVPPESIVLNPAAVNPQRFRPDCGGDELRTQFGFEPAHVVVGFVGSFSYWHGIPVLQDAIRTLLSRHGNSSFHQNLRFLLVGDGLLLQEMREALKDLEAGGWVIFPGAVPHEQVPSYLDASNILVSPHVPMFDGKPFFGSPSKLFEYMAMAKAIVASNLDQLAEVLKHDVSAWLVEPGNALELASAIRLLADDSKLRLRLGEGARRAVMEQHTWRQNAARLLAQISPREASTPANLGDAAIAPAQPREMS